MGVVFPTLSSLGRNQNCFAMPALPVSKVLGALTLRVGFWCTLITSSIQICSHSQSSKSNEPGKPGAGSKAREVTGRVASLS